MYSGCFLYAAALCFIVRVAAIRSFSLNVHGNNATLGPNHITASARMPGIRSSSPKVATTDYNECVLFVGDVQMRYFPASQRESNLTTTPAQVVTAVEGNYTLYVEYDPF